MADKKKDVELGTPVTDVYKQLKAEATARNKRGATAAEVAKITTSGATSTAKSEK